MSGGSMDYLYSKVQDAEFLENTNLRKAFRHHLQKVSEALRAIEWNDSGDGADNEDVLIRECLPNDAELSQAIKEAGIARNNLEEVLKVIQNKEV